MRMAKRTALVTGGAGFIGSHLAERLVADGWRVRVLDDLSSGRMSNLSSVKSKILVKKASVLDAKAVDEAVAGADTIFHMAAKVSVAESIAKPELYAHVNVAGLIQVLEAARKHGVRRFVFPSSASVYSGKGPPRKIEKSPLNPRSPYAVSKVLGEALCRVFHEDHGIETVSLRLFNVYGPRQDPSSPYSSVIPRFIDALAKRKRPVVFGDGNQTRDFINIRDSVEALVLAARSKRAAGEVFNIASGKATTILGVFTAAREVTGSKLEPRLVLARQGEVRHSCANITKARRILGFEPKVSLREGISQMVRGI